MAASLQSSFSTGSTIRFQRYSGERELTYDRISYIEHATGKRVRRVYRNDNNFSTNILFTDGTEGIVREGYDINSIEVVPVQHFCVSCGGLEHGAVHFDQVGRCPTTLKKIWESARKVYWHRYIKNRKLNINLT